MTSMQQAKESRTHEWDLLTDYCRLCGIAREEAMKAPGISAWSCFMDPHPELAIRERRALLWPRVPVHPRDIDAWMDWVTLYWLRKR